LGWDSSPDSFFRPAVGQGFIGRRLIRRYSLTRRPRVSSRLGQTTWRRRLSNQQDGSSGIVLCAKQETKAFLGARTEGSTVGAIYCEAWMPPQYAFFNTLAVGCHALA
jgi:hypothetical protein